MRESMLAKAGAEAEVLASGPGNFVAVLSVPNKSRYATQHVFYTHITKYSWARQAGPGKAPLGCVNQLLYKGLVQNKTQ